MLFFILFFIIVFQIFLFGFIILFHNEIFFNPSVKPISYEYWTWLTANPDVINNNLVDFVIAVYSITNFIFILGFIFVFSSKKFVHQLKIWRILLAFLFGYITYLICTLLIRFFSPDYRLYMLFIPTEILSLLLLFFILKAIHNSKTPTDNNVLK